MLVFQKTMEKTSFYKVDEFGVKNYRYAFIGFLSFSVFFSLNICLINKPTQLCVQIGYNIIKVLDKNGHEGVNIKELPTEMLKGDAVKHLSSIGVAGEDSNVKDALKKAAKKYGVSLTQPAVETTSTENVA